MDVLTRACLVVIALSLLAIAATAVGLGAHHPDSCPAAAAKDGEEGARFRLMPIGPGRQLLRLDTRTGDTWHTQLNRPDVWRKVGLAPEAESAPTPSATPAPEQDEGGAGGDPVSGG